MSREAKSQWNFGDLFDAPQAPSRKVYSVTEITQGIRRALEKSFGQIWVTGEVTNARHQSSGHIYFTLKDATAQLSCVLFRGEKLANRQAVQDGQKLNLFGELTVYEPRGQYQLRIMGIELQGVGALQQEFERLKQKLKDEGLFAQERKRPLPPFPERIGVVTSSSGAALKDVLHVVQRRQPSLQLVLASCRVQGQGAGLEIAQAIRRLNEFHAHPMGQKLDLILVTRGGGSLEDLWAFNEEVVARAIYESPLPVVSAVGHEIDFTISDFVADFRAATPSAAAEIITEGVFRSGRFVSEAAAHLHDIVSTRVGRNRTELSRWQQRLLRAHPRRKIQDRFQYVDDLQGSLLRCVKYQTRDQLRRFINLEQRLGRFRPREWVLKKTLEVELVMRRFREKVLQEIRQIKQQSLSAENRLRLLSPQSILQRGYSITLDLETGAVLRSADQVQPGQSIRTQLQNGEIESQVSIASSR